MLEFFRLLLVVFLVLHGIGHIIWFLAAWTPISAGVKDGPWILPGDVTIRSPIGKLLGLLALAVMLIFVFSALLLLLNERAWAGWAEMAVFLSLGRDGRVPVVRGGRALAASVARLDAHQRHRRQPRAHVPLRAGAQC